MTQVKQASGPSLDRQSIERFVRVTLGCKCRDEVFRSIVIDRVGADDANGVGMDFVRLTIGERLLIYIRAADQGHPASKAAATLAQAGIAERDARGLNRFRLVIARSGPPDAADDERTAFADIAGADGRAHLHSIGTGELPPPLR
jgi:hypothetical protein